jgi:hypothetical protein
MLTFMPQPATTIKPLPKRTWEEWLPILLKAKEIWEREHNTDNDKFVRLTAT